ncbi:hypothetical protein BH10BAC4_BH10BAC4_13510 [soil metagenome]
MKAQKIGIWMDHHQAYLTEFTADAMKSEIILSSSDTGGDRNFNKGERLEHNREQNELEKYYKKLSSQIIQYESVVLFGPTDAKTELLHLLRKNHLFDKIKITVENADKMTENQLHSFVRSHFSHQ